MLVNNGQWFDSMLLEVFSNPNDSMTVSFITPPFVYFALKVALCTAVVTGTRRSRAVPRLISTELNGICGCPEPQRSRH